MINYKKLRIAYWPNSYKGLNEPGDRRRFFFYTDRKDIKFELYDEKATYDIIILSQVADITNLDYIKKQCSKVIYDFNNSYHLDDFFIKEKIRGIARFLTKKSKKLSLNYRQSMLEAIASVDAVICVSKEQKDVLKKINPNIHCIPDMPNKEIINIKRDYNTNGPVKIVWEGLGNNVYQLNTLKAVFSNFKKNHDFVLHVISDKYFFKFMNRFFKISSENILKNLYSEIVFHEWNSETFSQNIIKCDIALIPIDPKNTIARGKPENKLILLWKMGMPTVTYNTVSYQRTMQKAGLDYCCINDEDWIKALHKLSSNYEHRRYAGVNGKVFAEKYYGEKVVIDKWEKLLETVL